MMTMLDSLRFRHDDARARQTRRDGGVSGRKAVLAFQPGSGPIALEPRALLSNVSWINAAGGDWDTGSNWNTGSVPGASDAVTINLSPGITVNHAQNDADSVNNLTVAGADTLSISNGSVSIASTSTIDGTLNLTGGSLEGAGALTVTGALTWTGGTMSGTGQTIATGAESINNGTLDTRSFTNDGTVTLSGTLSFDNSASFTNAARATFNAQTGASLALGDSSSPTFNNGGSFNVQASALQTVTDNGVAFTNSGAVNVSSGNLTLLDPGGTDSGSFAVALNATLDFGEKATTLSSQSSVSGNGSVVFDNNTIVTIDGGYSLGSFDTVMYATADEPALNGTFRFPPTYLFGTMDLTTGQFTAIASTNQLINSLTVAPGGSLYAGAAPPTPYLYTISPSGATSQFGTVSEPSDSASFDGLASDGAGGFFSDTVTKNADSTFTATLEHISADGNSSSVIGTMGASFGSANTGNLAFGPDGNLYFDAVNASGAPTLSEVNTKTGALTAVGQGLNTPNPLTLAANGTVLYGIDTYTQVGVNQLPAIYTIDTTTGVATQIGAVSGPDYGYFFDTMAPHPPAITPTCTTIVQNNAVVNFDGALSSSIGKMNITSGTANLGSNSVNLASLSLSGGTLTGTGTLTVTGTLTWSGGTMAGTGQTIALGAVNILDATLDTRSFTNDATVELLGTLSFDNSAGFTSAATASFDADNGASLALGDGSAATFNNAGTFNSRYGLADLTPTDNGVAFTNTGTIYVTSGTLSFSDTTLTNESVINQSGPGTLQINSGASLNNTSSGTCISSDGTLRVDGTLSSASAVTIPTGATLAGIGTVSGPVNVQSGGHLAPGDAVGSTGILHAASLTFSSGANFDFDLNGTTAGTQYD
jgi:fibronectin-binding autotransporter adhesin